MQHYISNTFSINMLSGSCNVAFRKVSLDAAKALVNNHEYESIMGHPDTVQAVNMLLGTEFEANRISVNLEDNWGWSLLVAQYTGDRLPEGATQLPENANITFWEVYQTM